MTDQIQVEERITAFVDILGMSARLAAWNGCEDLPRQLETAFRYATGFVGGRCAFEIGEPEEWRLSLFSDCACMSQPATPLGIMRALEGAALFQRGMITHGFIIRGGIAMGPHFENSFTLVSKGLVEACMLEQHPEGKPRILISKSILDYIETIEDASERREIKELITYESKTDAFVCYLAFEEEDEWFGGESFYQAQHEIITKALGDESLPQGVVAKYRWMAEYHNWCLWFTARNLKSAGIMTDDDVWAFRSHWIDDISKTENFESALRDEEVFLGRRGSDEKDGVNWISDWPGIVSEDNESEDGI